MRHESLYLMDMIDAARAIRQFIARTTPEAFVHDDLTRSAVLQKLIVIGEAAARLPKPYRERHPNIPWVDVIAMRNFVVHAYFSVEWEIIWNTATLDVPELEQALALILDGISTHEA
ncbi:MAG: DUF86 domain-containing protein [Magnetococcales bacterium]|nr:DUF86 domain-containing protein [Magnetococcales bacterium]MBF0321536.1 DUF86 domain-containing protein [Magnetococcales bacterium]MBF0321540.1 DUF86 domain-containing protein [Magnetococcales bacterium]